ncbi:MAG: hypothetical protein IPN90_09855 [Elusimicrobia bacterium]|nr:hypothetical protein [Elusimicrobiota bacterium]
MKKIKFLWPMAVFLFVGGLGLVLVWYNLNQRLNRPEFQANLEREISEALEGKISFASVRGQLGFRPWIGLGDIKFVGNNGDLRATAKELRVAVKVLPLFRKVVVFSQMKIVDPRLRVRRRPDGSEPVLPDFKGNPNRKWEGYEFQVQHLQIESHRGPCG